MASPDHVWFDDERIPRPEAVARLRAAGVPEGAAEALAGTMPGVGFARRMSKGDRKEPPTGKRKTWRVTTADGRRWYSKEEPLLEGEERGDGGQAADTPAPVGPDGRAMPALLADVRQALEDWQRHGESWDLPLRDLYAGLRQKHPGLSQEDFTRLMARLHTSKALRLGWWSGPRDRLESSDHIVISGSAIGRPGDHVNAEKMYPDVTVRRGDRHDFSRITSDESLALPGAAPVQGIERRPLSEMDMAMGAAAEDPGNPHLRRQLADAFEERNAPGDAQQARAARQYADYIERSLKSEPTGHPAADALLSAPRSTAEKIDALLAAAPHLDLIDRAELGGDAYGRWRQEVYSTLGMLSPVQRRQLRARLDDAMSPRDREWMTRMHPGWPNPQAADDTEALARAMETTYRRLAAAAPHYQVAEADAATPLEERAQRLLALADYVPPDSLQGYEADEYRRRAALTPSDVRTAGDYLIGQMSQAVDRYADDNTDRGEAVRYRRYAIDQAGDMLTPPAAQRVWADMLARHPNMTRGITVPHPDVQNQRQLAANVRAIIDFHNASHDAAPWGTSSTGFGGGERAQ